MVRTTDSTVGIIRAVAWPIVMLTIVLAVIFLFRDKTVPQNVEVTAQGIKISFYLLDAAEHPIPDGTASAPSLRDLRNIQTVARNAASISLHGIKVLWVDDNPEFQSSERNALQQLGIEFELARSTSEALPLLKQHQFQLVITDFARRDDPQGGYTLLAELKKISPSTPLIIYSASANARFIAEAKKKGAYTETNQPEVLFNAAINAIKEPPGRVEVEHETIGALLSTVSYGLLLVISVSAAIYSFTTGIHSSEKAKKIILLGWLVGPPTFFFLEYLLRHDGLNAIDLERMKDLQHLGSQVWAGVAAALATIYFKSEDKKQNQSVKDGEGPQAKESEISIPG